MPETDLTELARASYRAYQENDREAIEALVADEFTFYSPPDPGIDRASYFERCWPNAQALDGFEFVRLFDLGGGEVLVTYEATKADGKRFRNTEVLTFANGKMTCAEVYFGWDLED
jgi:ketosteroid isomerase-like protein